MFDMIVVCLHYVVLQYGTPHDPIHSLADKYVFTPCMYACVVIKSFMQTRMHGMGEDQLLHLKSTRLSASRDKHMESIN